MPCFRRRPRTDQPRSALLWAQAQSAIAAVEFERVAVDARPRVARQQRINRRAVKRPSRACQKRKCDRRGHPFKRAKVEVCSVGGTAALIRPCCSAGKPSDAIRALYRSDGGIPSPKPCRRRWPGSWCATVPTTSIRMTRKPGAKHAKNDRKTGGRNCAKCVVRTTCPGVHRAFHLGLAK